MKRVTIGRNPSCDIVIDNQMVSRNHALLNIYPTGKLEIVSMGTNGTKVKGNLISNGQRYPLKRGDDVVFAGSSYLDWSLVPDPMRVWRILGWAIAGALVLALLVWGVIAITDKIGGSDDKESEKTEQINDPSAPKADVANEENAGTAENASEKESEEKSKEGLKSSDKAKQIDADAFFPAERKSSPAKSGNKKEDAKHPQQHQQPKKDAPVSNAEEQEWGRH